MNEQAKAEEHLRVIRSLMEKAAIYRAVSAEAAAVGGLLALLASLAYGNPWWNQSSEITSPHEPSRLGFIGFWLGMLVIAGALNVLFLHREAKRRGDRFFSSGMKLALRALAPSFIVAGFFTLLATRVRDLPIVPIWMLCYGLALLSTQSFAPRSLTWLGWAFLLAGMGWVFPQMTPVGISVLGDVRTWEAWQHLYSDQRWMACTFGLFHLIYAACTWPRKSRASE
jgi:hypothetical protein